MTLAAVALGLWWHGRALAPTPIYDSSRNAALDISNAVAQARSSGRLVLLQVGGD